jgi:OOP family OmpA-OmpF porin
MKTRLFMLFVLACSATAAWSAPPPKNASYVDPDAPCFRWPAVDYDADGVFDRIDRCTNTPAGCTVDKWGCESDADGDGVCDGRDQCPDTPAGTKVDKDGCPPGARAAKVQEAPKEVTPPPAPAPVPEPTPPPLGAKGRELVETGKLRLENVFFESGSANLLPESEDELSQLGTALERFPDVKLEIQGHTDTRGAASGNMRLSQARADAVRTWLLSHYHGIHDANLTAKGYGETQPETKERNEEELLRNRRVELRLLNPEVLPKGVKVEH